MDWYDLVYPISIHAPLTGSDTSRYKTTVSGTDFNPRSPHRERRHKCHSYAVQCRISIHAPLTGSDLSYTFTCVRSVLFQSTLPSQGATKTRNISVCRNTDFNPRSPHRERPKSTTEDPDLENFNPRSPHRERPVRR